MATSKKTAQSLSDKMIHFRALLTNPEQKALDDLLRSIAGQVVQAEKKPKGARLFRSATSKNILVQMKKIDVGGSGQLAATPITLTTLTTITTTVASHPIITCSKSGGGATEIAAIRTN